MSMDGKPQVPNFCGWQQKAKGRTNSVVHNLLNREIGLPHYAGGADSAS